MMDTVWSEELNFPDGTVIIQTGKTLYRVYGGMLSRESPVLRKTLEHSPSEGRIDGCPVIRLENDPRDVEHFLQAMFAVEHHDLPYTADPFVVAGILRVASRYQVKALQMRIWRILSEWYPTSYNKYLEGPHAPPASRASDGRHIYMVNAIRDSNALAYLPTALLACCDYNLEGILNGVEYRGGRVELSARDKSTVILGRQTLMGYARAYTYWTLLSNPSRTCKDRTCSEAGQLATNRMLESLWFSPLLKLQLNVLPGLTFLPCDKCFDEIDMSFDDHADWIFNTLPKTFNFKETWTELMDSTPGYIASLERARLRECRRTRRTEETTDVSGGTHAI